MVELWGEVELLKDVPILESVQILLIVNWTYEKDKGYTYIKSMTDNRLLNVN